MDPKFEEVAFALEPSTTTSPKFVEVKTGFGYHIIMVSFAHDRKVLTILLISISGRRQKVDGTGWKTYASHKRYTHTKQYDYQMMPNFFYSSQCNMAMRRKALKPVLDASRSG